MNSLINSGSSTLNDNLIDTTAAKDLAEKMGQAEEAAQTASAAPSNEPKPEFTATSGPARVSMVIRKFRVMMEITPRELADQVGITTRELIAFEAGKECGSVVLVKILAWLLASS